MRVRMYDAKRENLARRIMCSSACSFSSLSPFLSLPAVDVRHIGDIFDGKERAYARAKRARKRRGCCKIEYMRTIKIRIRETRFVVLLV